ncbi:centrosomal protein of 128 kDa isoform X3 [Hyperolius riggenbachi]|uniref:centrosomal protein of 128 kDa isoform X3 n=1 Tax=Hyperolius riggenbachi TaxID=752182 RepID=UPI0035A3702B
MAESSSDSDSYLRTRAARRGPVRANHTHGRGRIAGDVSEKIHKLAHTLQDTSRNLQQVDEMLGQYREYNSDQTEAISTLKDTLEQSIDQLRSQRLSRLSGGRSASLSSLCASDLEAGGGTRLLKPTSPLKDYSDGGVQRRRRSRSAVRFLDEVGNPGQIHSLHQSLRDLSSDQLRLNDDLSRELARRNRTEAETKRTLEDLTSRLSESQRQETVSERVERRLQQLERDMRLERQQAERRQDHMGHVSTQLQEALKQRESKPSEAETSLKDRLGRSEGEKAQLEAELERYRRRLDQTEGSRETLLCQVEDLRSQLLKMDEDRSRLQHQVSTQNRHENHEEERRVHAAVERSEREKQELERQISELRTQLNRNAILSEIEELRRSLEHKDREKSQLTEQLEAAKEKDEMKSHLQVTVQQAENLRKELAEVLARRAQQEEELHLKQMRLTEAQDQQLDLEKELRESQELAGRLQEELQRQVEVQQQLQEDRERLQEQLLSAGRTQEKSNDRILELQEAVRDLSSERAELSSRLAQEEKSNKELRRNLCEAQKQAEFAREELNSAGRQLKMERDVHQRELTDLRSSAQTAKSKHERNIQEMLTHFRQEREELEGHIRNLKAELIDSKALMKSERQRVEKMKVECDKLSEEALRGKEESATLRCKYQLANQDAEEKALQISTLGQNARKLEDDVQALQEKLNSLETEQETILGVLEAEINSTCQLLSRDAMDRFKAVSADTHLRSDPHYWLAETKSKLQWLCEEVKEREERERKLRAQHQQYREQLKDRKLRNDSEKEALSQQVAKLEQQLEETHRDKKDFLDRSRRRDEEMWQLQDRIVDLERSTRIALDHLESVPEKLSFLDDIKDLNDSHLQREVMEERYAQYREIIGSLQQQLEDSKRRIQDYREEKFKADIQNARLTALSSSLRANGSFLSSSLRSTLSCKCADRDVRLNTHGWNDIQHPTRIHLFDGFPWV